MTTEAQIEAYVASQPQPKQSELLALHSHIMGIMPGCRLWFLDGKNNEGKTVSNPNIGYGSYFIHYAGGKKKEFYQVGLSANSGGISVYIMGIEDRKFLPDTFGQTIGKASVTGYCIKFKMLKDIRLDVLEAAIRKGLALSIGG